MAVLVGLARLARRVCFTGRPVAERRHEILAKPFCVSRCNDISVHAWALRYSEINLYLIMRIW
jgi:endogenous inhibitor of DNA gyrase (YacG/DUF329 family)